MVELKVDIVDVEVLLIDVMLEGNIHNNVVTEVWGKLQNAVTEALARTAVISIEVAHYSWL